MRISELITELANTLAAYGDMKVVSGDGSDILTPEVEWTGSVGSSEKRLNLNYIEPEG